MRKRNALLASAVIAGGLVAAPTWAQAATGHHSPASRTCAAFVRWEHHKSTANLDALMAISVYAPWQPLGADVVVLYTDVKDGNHTDAPSDASDVRSDCR